MLDLLIKNGLIIDGTGKSSYHANLGIKGDTIQFLGNDNHAAANIIDAAGRIVTPGFIDIHTHSDFGIIAVPTADNYVMQGVTTTVAGNCGFSLAPVSEKYFEDLRTYCAPFLIREGAYSWKWRSFRDFYDLVRTNGLGVNIVPFVGHGTLRIAVNGFKDGACSEQELKEMQRLLAECMEQGAFGMSTGLFYPPGSYSSRDELEALFPVLKNYGGIYSSHLRSEGKFLVESVTEAIELGERFDVSIELSHHKAAPGKYWGKIKNTLQLIREYSKKGVNVSCDVYPYNASSTTIMILLPNWALEGGVSETLSNLTQPGFRKEIIEYITSSPEEEEIFIRDVGWENVIIASCPAQSESEGKSLLHIVGRNISMEQQLERFMDWLIAIGADAMMVSSSMSQEDVDTVVRYPDSIIASDSWISTPSLSGKPHPRAYGTFPRFINEYVKKKAFFSIEEAIPKITSMPAAKMCISERGTLKAGNKADIVIMDLPRVRDTASFMSPKQFPEGIDWVIINGQIAVKEGSLVGITSGKILKKN